MEREVMLAGIGGQGVQLAAALLARAATLEGRHVLSLGTYGGTMRGGNTESVVVVGDAPLHSPPIVSRVWSALVVHPRFWAPVRAKLTAGSLVWTDPTRFDEALPEGVQKFEVPAAQLASDCGAPVAAALVLVAAFCGGTGLVGLDALCGALAACLPPYRQEHLPKNTEALRAGFAAAPAAAPPAWPAQAVA
ncbi:MAG: 2-oxoacid:acceptor oxidoreductase family protein [Proteobacteria bacterium]|nr:2-oxoacid:acceptor oxidoreductase family protein [Pseudomonadota bacterium]